MPDLNHSLRNFDYGHLRIIAEAWGLPLEEPDARAARAYLTAEMTSPELVEEIVEALPDAPAQALAWLLSEGGRAGWALFSRRYGEVREMGPGKRDRLRPDLNPESPAEVLWYRGFISRGFFETDAGPQEFAYIPDDLLPLLTGLLPLPEQEEASLLGPVSYGGRKATPEERRHVIPASDRILDHTCTMLAALRMDVQPEIHLPEVTPPEEHFYRQLLTSLGILNPEGRPNPEKIRDYLALSRPEAFLKTWEGWISSSTIVDLHHVPTLQAEGNWEYDPIRVRDQVMDFLEQVPRDTWWSLSSFIAWVKERHPDFQRPSGDYDSWFLKDRESGEYLRGYEHWDQVEGAFLAYMISGPLHWLGFLDIARPDEPPHGRTTAFRFSPWSASLLKSKEPAGIQPEEDPIHIRSKGEIDASPHVPRTARYQIGRFCDWLPIKQDHYYYALTPSGLQRAQEQGLKIPHLRKLLQRHTDAVPPNILKALQRWDQRGEEVTLNQETILRLRRPSMLKALQKTNAARFLREQLGPTAVVIKPGSERKIVEALVEMGFLTRYDMLNPGKKE
jgi:hypothetical protein